MKTLVILLIVCVVLTEAGVLRWLMMPNMELNTQEEGKVQEQERTQNDKKDENSDNEGHGDDDDDKEEEDSEDESEEDDARNKEDEEESREDEEEGEDSIIVQHFKDYNDTEKGSFDGGEEGSSEDYYEEMEDEL